MGWTSILTQLFLGVHQGYQGFDTLPFLGWPHWADSQAQLRELEATMRQEVEKAGGSLSDSPRNIGIQQRYRDCGDC